MQATGLTLEGELRRLRYERDGKSTTYMHARSYIYAHNNTITVGASWNKQVSLVHWKPVAPCCR